MFQGKQNPRLECKRYSTSNIGKPDRDRKTKLSCFGLIELFGLACRSILGQLACTDFEQYLHGFRLTGILRNEKEI